MFLIFVLILVAMKYLCCCSPRIKEFAKQKFDSIIEIWVFNGMIQAFAFTFLDQAGSVSSKLIQMSQMDEVDVASKIGATLMLTLLIIYLILIFTISYYFNYWMRYYSDEIF